jgi:hypothetical protein
MKVVPYDLLVDVHGQFLGLNLVDSFALVKLLDCGPMTSKLRQRERDVVFLRQLFRASQLVEIISWFG